MKLSYSPLIVVLLFVTRLTAGLVPHGQIHHVSTEINRLEEWILNIVYDSDKTPSPSLIPFDSTSLTRPLVPNSLHRRDTNIDMDTILPPSITPITSIAGVFLILSGLLSALVGIKNQRLQAFLSTTYIVGLGIAVLILHLADPPVSLAIQGAYLVAILIPALLAGGLSLLVKNFLSNIGSIMGGFCLAMFFMTLRDGGLFHTIVSKAIFIICFMVGIYVLSFNRHIQAYILVGSTSMVGATALILGVDCFSLAGLKEFWVYVWGVNNRLFPENQATYELSKGIIVELIMIALLTILGIFSQMRLWKVFAQQKHTSNQTLSLTGHRREDVESGHTRVGEETQCYEIKEMDYKHLSKQSDSCIATRVVNETGELHPVTMEAVQTAYPKSISSDNLDDTITHMDSIEPIISNPVIPTRTPSTSTTLAGTIKSYDEPFPYLGKVPTISRTDRRQEDKHSTTTFQRNKSSSPLRQLMPSTTFMEIVATKLKRLSQITGIPTTGNVDLQQSSIQNSQFDHLAIDETQISRPLIEGESAEQFVSSFLGSAPISTKTNEPRTQTPELQKQKPVQDVSDEDEVSVERPPTRRGPISVKSKSPNSEKSKLRARSLLSAQSTDIVPCQSTDPYNGIAVLANKDSPSDLLSKSRMLVKAEPQVVLEKTKSSQSLSALDLVSFQPKANSTKTENIPRALTAKPGYNTDLAMNNSKIASTTTTISNRSNLRSSIGTWPQHNNTKHSLQRRLETSLRNSRSCVLTSPIDEDAVASFAFRPLTDAEILRRASYPRRSRTGLSAGDSIRQTFDRSISQGTHRHGSTNTGSRDNSLVLNSRQYSRRSSDGPALSRRQQVYLESIRSESHVRNHGQVKSRPHSTLGKSEQPKIPQHTLYRASMLAEWRRSNPMDPKYLGRVSTPPPSSILGKASPEPETSTPTRMANLHTNSHRSIPATSNQRIAESKIYGLNHKTSSNNTPGSERRDRSVTRRSSPLSSREVNIHKEVLRCMQAGTWPVFEDSNIF